MAKSLCIIHANCQGDGLKQLLLKTPRFSKLFDVVKYTNFQKENIPPEYLEKCALFLYQHIGDHWGDIASQALLQKLPPKAVRISLPNMYFTGYWPLFVKDEQTEISFGDILLERLIHAKLSHGEIKHIYLKGNLCAKYDLDALCAASRKKEEAKEAMQDVKTLHLIDTYWRDEQLFYTINHPRARLQLHVANSVLNLLGLGKLLDTTSKEFSDFEEEFELPIHPQVGQYYALPFASQKRQYNIINVTMPFDQYVDTYISYYNQNPLYKVNDFVLYLELLTQKMQKNAKKH